MKLGNDKLFISIPLDKPRGAPINKYVGVVELKKTNNNNNIIISSI
jgi:hypothetical protein